MRTILFLCALIAISVLRAQELPTQTVRGTVREHVTGLSLPGAHVILLGSDPVRGTTSDTEGRFRLENVPVGRIGVRVSYIGFKDRILESLNLTSGKELVLEIDLEESVILKDEVVISATHDKRKPVNDLATVSSRSFTVEETQRYAGSLNDVARMAANFAGVRGTDDARNDIIIRGNSPTGLLWRLEGVDIPNPNHYGALETTGGPVNMLNNNQLANSDFITGAFPAEYGNALSGVFDLKMRTGNDEKHEFLGQIGFNGLELGAEGPLGKPGGASYLLNYRYSTLEFFDLLGVEFGTGTAVPKYQDLSFKVNIPRTALGNFSIFGLGGTSQVAFLDSEKDTTEEHLDFYGGEGYDLINGSDMGVMGINHTYWFNDRFHSRLILAATYHRFQTEVDSISPSDRLLHPYFRNDNTEKRLYGSWSLHKKFSARHNLKTGLTVTRSMFNLTDSVFIDEDSRFRINSDYEGGVWLLQPFVHWQCRIRDHLTLNTGIHYQYFFFNYTHSFEPRAGITWTFREGQSVSLAYGLHSQIAPVTAYFNQVRMPDGSYVRTSEDLDMTRSQHFVAGYDRYLNEHLRIKAEAYYQLITDAGIDGNERNSYSILNQGANFYVWTPDSLVNGGTGDNYGIDITLERFLHNGFYFLVTGSLYESRYEGSDGIRRFTAFSGDYIANALAGREWVLGRNAEKKKQKMSVFQVDMKITMAGGQRYTPARVVREPSGTYVAYYDDDVAYTGQFRDFFRTDLRVAFRQEGKRVSMEWAIEVQNLFDNQNIYGQKFNSKTGEVDYTYQLGMMVIPQFRVRF